MNEFNPKNFFDLSDPLFHSLFSDLENPWSVLKGNLKKYLKEIISEENVLDGDISPNAFIEGSHIHIAKGAKVEAGAFIKGPVYIGPGTEVRHGAYIRGNVLVGENCVVGHSTEIKHSILFNGAKAGHFNYIGDSVLGNDVNLGAGTKLANLKITPGNVSLKYDGKNIDSGLRKFGSILGDKCETGCNSVLNPGTTLSPKSLVFPNFTANGAYTNRTVLGPKRNG